MTQKRVVNPGRFISLTNDPKPTDGGTTVNPGSTLFEYNPSTGSITKFITYDGGDNWVVTERNVAFASLFGEIITDLNTSGTRVSLIDVSTSGNIYGILEKILLELQLIRTINLGILGKEVGVSDIEDINHLV